MRRIVTLLVVALIVILIGYPAWNSSRSVGSLFVPTCPDMRTVKGAAPRILYEAHELPPSSYTSPLASGGAVYLTTQIRKGISEHSHVLKWTPGSEERITPEGKTGRLIAVSGEAILVAESGLDYKHQEMVLIHRNGRREVLPMEFVYLQEGAVLIGETVYAGSRRHWIDGKSVLVPPEMIEHGKRLQLAVEGADELHFSAGAENTVVGHFFERGPDWFYRNVPAHLTEDEQQALAAEVEANPLKPFEWASVLNRRENIARSTCLQRDWRSQLLSTNGMIHVGLRSEFGLDKIGPEYLPVIVDNDGARLLPHGVATTGRANGISQDGVIVGELGEYFGADVCPVAVAWVGETAPVYLEDAAVGLEDFQLHTATSISPEGWIIACGGPRSNPRDGEFKSFVLIPTSPPAQ